MRNFFIAILATTALTLTAPSHSAEKTNRAKKEAVAFELKGAKLGATAEEIDKEFGTNCKSSDKTCMILFLAGIEIKNKIPESKRLFADTVVTGYIFGLDSDKKVEFIHVKFKSEGFASAYEALRAKYGEPSDKTKSTIQNGFGGTFSNLKAYWKGKNEGLALERYSDDLKTSSVTLISKFAGEKAIRERSEAISKPGSI